METKLNSTLVGLNAEMQRREEQRKNKTCGIEIKHSLAFFAPLRLCASALNSVRQKSKGQAFGHFALNLRLKTAVDS
jgi:hypothetical protein